MLVLFHVFSALLIPFLYIHSDFGLSEKLSQPPASHLLVLLIETASHAI